MSYDANPYDAMPADADPELDDLRAQAAHDRRTANRLRANPDCRDPDHHGCIHCEGEDE